MSNKIHITGRLGQDSETRFMPNGDPVLSFSVADDIGFGDKKTTQWWRCSMFGKRGETLAQYLKKGQQVVVHGDCTMREWATNEGEKKHSLECRVSDVDLVGGKREECEHTPSSSGSAPGSNSYQSAKGGSSARQATPPPPPQTAKYDDSDIPF